MKRHILPWATFVVALCLALPAGAGNGRSVNGLIAAVSQHSVAVKGRRSDRHDLRRHAGLPLAHAATPRAILSRWSAAPARAGSCSPGSTTSTQRPSVSRAKTRRRSRSAARSPRSPTTRSACTTVTVTSPARSIRRRRRRRTSRSASTSRPNAPAASSSRSQPITPGRRGPLLHRHGQHTRRQGAHAPDGAWPRHLHDRLGLAEHGRAQRRRQDRHGLQGIDDATRPDQEARRRRRLAAAPPAPPAGDPTTHTTTGARGAVSAVSSTAVSVLTDGGTVTCQLGSSSPALGDLEVGDHVAMKCLDGVLATLERVS